MKKFLDFVKKFLNFVHNNSVSIVLLTMIVLVAFCIGWLCFVTRQLKPDFKPVEVNYTYAIQQGGQTNAVPKVAATPSMSDDERHFKVYKEVEEILRNQMNSWLTILTLLGMILGLIVPLASYLLQRRTLEEERKQLEDEIGNMKKDVDAAKQLKDEIDKIGADAKAEAEKSAQAIVEQKLKEIETSIIGIANENINKVRESLEGKLEGTLEKKESALKAQISELRRSFGSGEKATPTKFEETLEKAKQGDAQARFDVGGMYYLGDGCVSNYTEAYKWYRKAAEQGDADAQFALGVMLEDRRGCGKEAVEWYRKAAEQGHAKAQYNLGEHLRDGIGCAKDEKEAMGLFRAAAEQGLASALTSVAEMMERGGGECEKDEAGAVEKYREAADRGDAGAQWNLGRLHEFGLCGVEKSFKEAAKWYRKAVGEKGCTKWQDGAWVQVGELARQGLKRVRKGKTKKKGKGNEE